MGPRAAICWRRVGVAGWVFLLIRPTALCGPLSHEERSDLIVSVRLAADPPLTDEEASRIHVSANIMTQEGRVRASGRPLARTVKSVDLSFSADRLAEHWPLELWLDVLPRPDSPFHGELRRLVRVGDFGSEGRLVLDLAIQRRERIRVWFKMLDRVTGTPVAAQPVAVMEQHAGGASESVRVTTDHEGSASFEMWGDANHELSAAIGGVIPACMLSKKHRLALPKHPNTAPNRPLIWQIEVPQHSVRGRVTLEAQAGAPQSAPEAIHYLAISQEEAGFLSIHIGVQDGRFDIYDLDTGTYRLAIYGDTPSGYKIVRGGTVHIPREPDQPLEHHMVVAPRQRARCDFVVIDKETHEPMANVDVTVGENNWYERLVGGSHERFTTDDHGRGRIRTWEGPHTVTARVRRYVPHVEQLSLENRRTYHIELEPLKRTEVIVFDQNDQPLENATVVFVCSILRPRGNSGQAKTGRGGKAELWGLPTRPFAFVVTPDGRQWYLGRIEVPAAEPLKLRLSRLVTLKGRVQGEFGARTSVVPVELQHRMHVGRVLVDADGQFRLQVVPGRYSLYLVEEIVKAEVPPNGASSIEPVAYPIGLFDATAVQRTVEQSFTFGNAIRKNATPLEAIIKP